MSSGTDESSVSGKQGETYNLQTGGNIHQPIDAKPVRQPGQWIGGAISIGLLLWLAWVIATNDNLNWQVVGRELFGSTILQGVWVTLSLTVIATVIGIVLGVMLAIARLSSNPVLVSISSGYIWFFRGTPLLVQLLIWFNLALFFPTLGFGSFQVDTNSVITAYGAALLGLGLNEGAYQAEIMRSGIQAVDPGQVEAASALGFQGSTVMWRVILPQAMRVVIPPMGNNLITMLKMTSLVTVIAAPDLLNRAQAISARNFYVFELLIVATLWYLVLTTIFSLFQRWLEKKVGRGFTSASPSPRKKLRKVLRPRQVSDTQIISAVADAEEKRRGK